MYADHTVLYVDSSTPNGIKSKLDSDLHSLEKWFKAKRLCPNVTKTKFMIYGTNQILKRFVNLELSLDRTPIKHVDQFKYLGAIFDGNLNWSDHINLVYKKASSKLFLFRKLRPFLEIKQAKTVFTALVKSILDYGDTIWFSCSQSSQKTFQSMQNISNKLIRSHPISDLLDTLDWTDLRTRRQQHRCRLAFRSLRVDVPPYLLRLLSKRYFRNRPSTRASFRQTFDIPLTANKTADCAFSVTMPRMLNNFDDVLLDASSSRIFNSHLGSHSLNLICDNT